MRTPFTTVTNSEGRTFAVRHLPAGARYGRANCVVNDTGKDQVEFYDASTADDTDGDYTPHDVPIHGFGPLGQFTGGRYYVETILGEDGWGSATGGLNLHGGVSEWQLDAAAMATVRDWLRETRAALVPVG